jgi:formylglycine-generating enzyme required for sulfatase activity
MTLWTATQTACAVLAWGVSGTCAAVDFSRHIQPLIESACLHCHSGEETEGDLRLDSLAAATSSGSQGPAIVPGKPLESPFYTLLVLPEDHDQIMPPEGPPLTSIQTDLVKQWISQGAPWPADRQLTVQPRIDFVTHIQPLLETHCLTCHQPSNSEGEYDLSTRATAAQLADGSPALVAFDPEASPLYLLTRLAPDDSQLMPPREKGGPLADAAAELLRLWITQGAVWPDGLTLHPRAKKPTRAASPDNVDLVRRLHALILAQSRPTTEAQMQPYRHTIPLTGAAYEMVVIRGGTFTMGSPAAEPHREATEGPQSEVTIAPFWMGKYEVTWDEYEPFMITQVDRRKNGSRTDYDPELHTDVDAVSQPTAPYIEMSFGMGQSGYPAISMTQHAANKFCQWLSAQTGHFYRLPTEAEWEYACRAGTTTAYSFGDDAAALGDYAWYYDNSNEKYQPVGRKEPNAWGLYDMHGNVCEWTADQFASDYFPRIGNPADNPFLAPQTLYPRTVRGGSWYDDPEQLRSASRRGSDPAWKQQDPQLPKSIWYHTDARWLGFRIVRPLHIPDPEQMHFYWNSATNKR